jgi:hypothetical protein
MKSIVFRHDYHCSLNVQSRLQLTVCRFAMGGIFTTELYEEHKTFGYLKTVCGARNPAYCKCAVSGWRFYL